MSNKKFVLLICILYLTSTGTASGQIADTAFSFVLSEASKTSAGIYKSDGTLVRTLWSGKNINAGRHKIAWDSTLR